MENFLHVEQANLSHISFLSDFGKSSFIYAYKLTLPVEELRTYVNEAFSEELIKYELESSEALYLICKNEKGVICGYAKFLNSAVPYCVTNNKAIELQRLYIRNEARGKGAGGLLFKNGISLYKERGFKVVWLRVWEGNTAAQNIYMKWGYAICGQEWYEVGKEKRRVLIMMKQI